jgi:bacterioferritin
MMQGSSEIVKLLNGLLTIELRAINQYFLDCKLAAHWGFDALSERFHDASFDEMRDAEKLMDRILLLGGLPNLQRSEPFAVGETVPEQLRAAVELEIKGIAQYHAAIRASEEHGDDGTATMLREMLLGEEEYLGWLETQLSLVETLGDTQYLALQVRK